MSYVDLWDTVRSAHLRRMRGRGESLCVHVLSLLSQSFFSFIDLSELSKNVCSGSKLLK